MYTLKITELEKGAFYQSKLVKIKSVIYVHFFNLSVKNML